MTALLMLHLPGFSWQCLMNDDANHLLPTFLKLIEQGSSGSLPAVGPYPLMDGIIMTGKQPSENGLLTRKSPRADGLGVDTTSSNHINCLTLAEYLDQHGYKCASINMKATHFLRLQQGLVVSDQFADIRTKHVNNWGIPPGSLCPLEMSDTCVNLRVHPEELLKEQLQPFISNETMADKEKGLRIIAKTLAENSTAHAVTTHLLESDDYDFLTVTYPALTQLTTHFAKAEKQQPGEGTVWQFMMLLDAFLARLITLLDKNASIFISGGADSQPFWIAQGPHIDSDQLFAENTSLYDIVPTVLTNFGIASENFIGVKQVNIFKQTEIVKKQSQSVLKDYLPSENRLIEGLITAGFIKTEPTLEQQQAIDLSYFRKHFALAENYRIDNNLTSAINEYLNALNIIADDITTLLRLCHCYLETGEYLKARQYVDQISEQHRKHFDYIILLAYILMTEKKMFDASALAYTACGYLNGSSEKEIILIKLHRKLKTIFLGSKMPEKADQHQQEIIKIKHLQKIESPNLIAERD